MPASAYLHTPPDAPIIPIDDLLPRIAWLREVVAPRLDRFLGYYRNHSSDLAAALPCPPGAAFSTRPFRQYQELGLPARITGFRRGADGSASPTGPLEIARKEVVIENDIAWRLNTVVEFAAGRVPAITSAAADPGARRRLTAVIQQLLQLPERAGQGEGLALLQRLMLEGAIAGSAWLHLRPTPALLERLAALASSPGSGQGDAAAGPDVSSTAPPASGDVDAGRWFSLEVVEAGRLCPLPTGDASADPLIPTTAALLAQDPAPREHASLRRGIFDRVRAWIAKPALADRADAFVVFTNARWQRCAGDAVLDAGDNLLGVVPFIRYLNAPDPAAGTRVGPAGSGAADVGIGDVEPLIGLQDELNTRLSDRACRVTMSCFRMFLGKGIENFTKRPVGPGQMWATDNPDASIESFGGDADMPSEEAHISEIRDAMDKVSGVSPVAAGLIRGKLGNLTSAVALRLTLIALLARAERKRAALTHTLSAAVRVALAILDEAGVVASRPEERAIDVNWPTPLPESDIDRLNEAQAKIALGIPRRIVLAELGYGEVDLPDSPQSSAPQ